MGRLFCVAITLGCKHLFQGSLDEFKWFINIKME